MYYFKRPKKSLGQNFLVDKNIINKIIKIGKVQEGKTILEIGPGYGALTRKLNELNPKEIIVVEKDKNMITKLNKSLYTFKNIQIINEDILNYLEKKSFYDEVIIFGNLPYNISTKILATLILIEKWPPWYETLIFMFQKEVADRILAKTNSKEFGRLAVLCNWRLEIKKHFNVSNNCFYPKPKVNSTVLSFTPKKKNNYLIKNAKNLEKVTRILFSNRRKMINKSFLKLFNNNKSAADELNLKLNKRPGEISCEMFYKITMKYEKLIG